MYYDNDKACSSYPEVRVRKSTKKIAARRLWASAVRKLNARNASLRQVNRTREVDSHRVLIALQLIIRHLPRRSAVGTSLIHTEPQEKRATRFSNASCRPLRMMGAEAVSTCSARVCRLSVPARMRCPRPLSQSM